MAKWHNFLGTYSPAWEENGDLTTAAKFFYQRADKKSLDSFGSLGIYSFSRVLGNISLLNVF